jgi:hypothetical protein
MKNFVRIKSLAVALLVTGACGQSEQPLLDSWVGAETVFKTEEYNNDVLNANLANANLANANLANANLANSALANVARITNLINNNVKFTGGVTTSAQIGAATVNSISISNGVLTGVRATDSAVLNTPSAFSGAYLKGRLSDSSDMDLHIDSVVYDSVYKVNWYMVSMSFDSGYTWGPLCPNGAGAIPLPTLWDPVTNQRTNNPTLFTWACDGAALAKCFKWGYDPNLTKAESDGMGHSKAQALGDWHQACTRLVTADYCGNGVSHTRTGTPIDIYDNLGIEKRDGSLGSTEADWGVDGAHCIRQTRWVNATGLGNDLDYVTLHCPSRLAANDVANCGTDPNQDPKIDITNFPSANGYNVSTAVRSLLRNDSYGFLP